MKYYQFNIGDYKRDTVHLSPLEHGIYRMLLDSYYDNEGPLPADDAKLMRTHRIVSEDEKQAFKNVISDFFYIDNGFYRQDGADKVISAILEKSEKARASAELRWQREKKKNANAMRTQCEMDADGMLPITHNPIPITQDTVKAPAKSGPILLKTFIEQKRQSGEKPFTRDDAIYKYAENIKLPPEYLAICWQEFKEKHLDSGKRYKDWKKAFGNCVRGNWYKLWWMNPETNEYQLTTAGQQAQKNMKAIKNESKGD